MKTPTTFRAVTRASLSLLVLAGAPAAFLACSGAGDGASSAEAQTGSTASAASKSLLGGTVVLLPTRCLKVKEGPLVASPRVSATLSTATPASTAAPATTVNAGSVSRLATAPVIVRGGTRLDPQPPVTTPDWVASCSLTKYNVRTGTDTCAAVTTPRGTWGGASAFPGVSTGVCTYTWSGAAVPTAADYQSLDGAAARTEWGGYSINANCPGPDELPADCGIPLTNEAVPSTDPRPHFAPDSGIIPQGLSSCDVCATSGVDRLYVSLNANTNPSTIWALDNQGHFVQFTPAASQLFVVPVAPNTFTPGAPISLVFGH